MKLTTTKLLSDAKTSKGATGLFQRFRKDESGAMIIFSLFLFVLVLWFGGMAIDLMRFETTRAKLQGTLDRATLAAADLDQTMAPADVVRDYMTKAGMIQFLQGEPDVDQGINFRKVTINAQAEMPLMFGDLIAVLQSPFNPDYRARYASLTVGGASTAEERVSDVEVSLVLDVSGSMDRNSRIQNLRPAAREFVTTVLANNTNAPQGLITISMIPYSAVVNPGTAIEPFLNINRSHSYTTCPLFPDDAMFLTTELDIDAEYNHVAHFDPDWYSDDPEPIGYPWCHVGNHNAIVTHTTNETTLHNAINALVPYGNTAIDMGMKWGVGLLDPSTRDIVSGLAGAANSGVPAIASGRPYDHTQPDVLKVIVLMTDGANTQQYDLIEPYKSGMSYVWFDLDDEDDMAHEVDSDEVSVQYEGVETEDYFWDDRFYWNNQSYHWYAFPNGYTSQQQYVDARNAGIGAIRAPGAGVTYDNNVRRASWQDLYASFTHNRVNNELLRKAYNDDAIPWSDSRAGYPDYIDADNARNTSVVNSDQANSRLDTLCQAARDAGIIVYTVSFEAPTEGRNALSKCATSTTHYFDVDGTDISDAFGAIASDIRALKLTE